MSFMSHAPLNGHGRKMHERCDGCGQRAAFRRGDTVIFSHNCAKVPGPSAPPLVYRSDTVEFVEGDFTVDELRAQRDAAEAELNEMRPEFQRRGRVIETVQAAVAKAEGRS